MLDQFRDALRDRLIPLGGLVRRWSGVRRNRGNVLEVRHSSHEALLYVKESRTTPGFWGLNPNRLDALREQPSPWAAVLLLSTQQRGYLIPAPFIAEALGTRWSQSLAGDYKVREARDLAPLAAMSYDALTDAVLASMTPGTPPTLPPFSHTSIQRMAFGLTKVPGKDIVLSVKPSNLRYLDLVAAVIAFALVPGDTPVAMMAKAIPLLAKLVDVVTDDDAIVLKLFVEIADGARAANEQALLDATNGELVKRKRLPMRESTLRQALDRLKQKGIIDRLPGARRSWRLSPPDLWL